MNIAWIALAGILALAGLVDGEDFSAVPGIVIDHSPAASGIYIGSPTLAVLPDGSYVAAHDEFGPKSAYYSAAVTHVFRSIDKGVSWRKISTIKGALWSTLFVHKGDLYLMGVHHEYSNLLIRRSTDGGVTWTDPADAATGLLAKGKYHTAPVPVVEHDGRLWRCVEDAAGPGGWGKCFRALCVSAPVDSDLLNARSWTMTNIVPRDASWLNGKFGGWLEGNAVLGPDGNIVDVLRVDARPDWSIAAMIHISRDGREARFDPATGFVKMPGADKKFTIRRDDKTNLYWSLTNDILPQDAATVNSERTRNTVCLVSSPDLINWSTRCILLHHPDWNTHAFQYLDWRVDGEDIIAVSRTAFDDGHGGAHSGHDANFLTFHRFKNFRNLTMKDSVALDRTPAMVNMASIAMADPSPTTHPAADAGDDALVEGFHLSAHPTSFDDPIQHGAADPSAVWNVKANAIYVYYTQRRAAFTTGKGVEWMFGSAIGVASTTDGHDWKYLGTLKGDHHLSDPAAAGMTWWAPEVKRIGNTYHMWVANPDGIYTDWRGKSYIRHYTSDDGLNWNFCDTPDLKSANVIDPGLCRVGDVWKMWYKDPSPGGFTIFTAISPDLTSWTTTGPAFQPQQPNNQYEGPFVFAWKSRYWLIVDTTQNGCDVFSSDVAGTDWQKAGHLWGAHMGVIAAGNRRYLVSHRGLPKTEQHPGLHGHDTVIDLRELGVNEDGKLMVQ